MTAFSEALSYTANIRKGTFACSDGGFTQNTQNVRANGAGGLADHVRKAVCVVEGAGVNVAGGENGVGIKKGGEKGVWYPLFRKMTIRGSRLKSELVVLQNSESSKTQIPLPALITTTKRTKGINNLLTTYLTDKSIRERGIRGLFMQDSCQLYSFVLRTDQKPQVASLPGLDVDGAERQV